MAQFRSVFARTEGADIDSRVKKAAIWVIQINLVLLAVYVLRAAHEAGWLSWLPAAG